MKKIRLDTELHDRGLSVENAIAKRRSERNFSGRPMSLNELSHLLYYSAGITDTSNGFRAAPSAGATYPIEIYPAVHNINGVETGIYHYLITTHELQRIRNGDLRQEMARAALEQKVLAQANVVLIFSCVYRRTQQRYRERGQRYILLEAGHIAQNACLVAVSLGLGACVVGAFYDRDFNRLLELDGTTENVIYLVAVGKL